MARRGENIYKRKDGRWEGRYKKGRKLNGRLKYGYIYGKTYKEVREKLYYHKVKYQVIINEFGKGALSYEEWTLFWLSRRKKIVKQGTYSTYFYKFRKYVFPILGEISLNQLTKEDLQKWGNYLEDKGFEPSTIHVLYQMIKTSLKSAYQQEYILSLPCEGIILPKRKKSCVKALTVEEQKSIEDAAKKATLKEGVSVLLGINAGLRIGEISALKWEDIDFYKKTISIKHSVQRLMVPDERRKTKVIIGETKTDKSTRVIPMSRTLCKYLKKWKKKADGPFICSNKLTPAEPRLLTYYFHKIRSRCGLERIHFHQLRHTFATRCIESNGDIASVSHLLGNASIKTTLDIYTDSFMEGRQQVIRQMDAAKKK